MAVIVSDISWWARCSGNSWKLYEIIFWLGLYWLWDQCESGFSFWSLDLQNTWLRFCLCTKEQRKSPSLQQHVLWNLEIIAVITGSARLNSISLLQLTLWVEPTCSRFVSQRVLRMGVSRAAVFQSTTESSMRSSLHPLIAHMNWVYTLTLKDGWH